MRYLCARIAICQMKLQVKKILKQKGITQRELAKRMGIHPESLTRILAGNPTMSTLGNLAKALEVEMSELFEVEHVIKISGYLEVGGVIHKINSKMDLDKFYREFVKNDHICWIDPIMSPKRLV